MIAVTSIIRNLSELFYAQKEAWFNLKVDRVLHEFDSKYKEVYRDIVDQIVVNVNQKSLGESLQYMQKLRQASALQTVKVIN